MLRMPYYKAGPPLKRIWCGPYAVALLLGVTYYEAYDMLMADARRVAAMAVHVDADRRQDPVDPSHITEARKAVRVTGTYPHQVARTLGRKGVRCNFTYYYDDYPTMLRFLRERPVGTFLIDAADHWIVVEDGVLYHSYLPGSYPETPEHIEDRATGYRKARVLAWAEVEPLPGAHA